MASLVGQCRWNAGRAAGRAAVLQRTLSDIEVYQPKIRLLSQIESLRVFQSHHSNCTRSTVVF